MLNPLLHFPKTLSHNEKFKYFAEKIAFLQKGLKENFAIEKIFIGGGSARAILDYLYFGNDLAMRDIDIFITFNRQCSAEFAEHIGKMFHDSILGFYSQNDLRPRPRAHTKEQEYNAGYGFFWIHAEDKQILDLSIFHSAADIELNGIFDIDKIRIPLTYPENLFHFSNKLANTTFHSLVEKKIIEDNHHGYFNWVQSKAKIIHWKALQLDPIVTAIRIVRTYGKLNYQYLPQKIKKYLTFLIKNTKQCNSLQYQRSLTKILSDERAEWIFKNLFELGLFTFQAKLTLDAS